MKLSERLQFKQVIGIYKITNLINGTSYVGQSKDINQRIYEHLRSSYHEDKSDYNYPLHRAIRKYGEDMFSLEVLETCSIAQLNEREEYWVAYFNTRQNGYNQTVGGQQHIRLIKLEPKDVDEIKYLLANTTLSKHEIAAKFNVSADFIYRINIGRAWNDTNYTYPIRPPMSAQEQRKLKFYGYKIQQLDKYSDEVIKEYSSIGIINLGNVNTDYTPHIMQAIQGKRKTAYGYKWRKVDCSYEDWVNLV